MIRKYIYSKKNRIKKNKNNNNIVNDVNDNSILNTHSINNNIIHPPSPTSAGATGPGGEHEDLRRFGSHGISRMHNLAFVNDGILGIVIIMHFHAHFETP